MTRRVLSLAQLPALATAAAAVGLLVFTGRRELVLQVYVLVLGAFALALLAGSVRRRNRVATVSAFDNALRAAGARRERLADLELLERELEAGHRTAADLHFRFRPRLRTVAAGLLASRRGIDLDTQPEAARSALGEELWELVRADRPAPHRREGPGLTLPESERLVTALERL